MHLPSPRSPWLILQGATAVVLLSVFALLFLVHVPKQTTFLTARNFRLLADSGDQIKSTIGTLYTSLTNAAGEALDASKGDGYSGTNQVKVALGNIIPKLQIVEQPWLEPSTDQLRRVTITFRRDFESVWLNFKYLQAAPPMELPKKDSNTPPDRTNEVVLSQGTLRFEVQTDFQKFVQRLIPRNEFDEVFLSDENGDVIFQADGGEVRVTRLPFVADTGENTNRTAVTAAMLQDLELSGTEYKAFAQPLYFALPHAAGETNALVKWVLVGMMRTKEFRSQTLTVRHTVVILAIFAVTFCLLSWPFLNVVLAGPREELKAFSAFNALAAAFLACGALTLLLLDANAYPRLQKTMKHQLQDFSRHISTNLLEELGAVNRQLLAFDRKARQWPETRTNRVHVFTNEEAIYPHLRMAVWANAGGQQLYKWATGPQATPFVSVGDRSYFRQIVENRAWPLDVLSTNSFFAFTNGFSLEPIYSRTRGENVTIYAIGSSQPGLERAHQPVVVYAEFRPLSLVQPLVPAGYGFCVINSDGRVLYHSEERRNLRENFVTECENDPRLRAAIKSRTEASFTAEYFMQPHHVFVAPLPGFPWTLVTFRDKSLLNSAREEMLSVSTILYGLYGLFVLGGLALVYFTHARRHPDWIWPDVERNGGYQWILVSNLIVVAIFVAGFLVFPSVPTLLAHAVLLPLVAVVVAYRILKDPELFRRGPWRRFVLVRLWFSRRFNEARREACASAQRSPDETSFSPKRRVRVLARLSQGAKRFPWPPRFRPAYVMALGSLLAVVALLPAAGFYKIGFGQEVERFVKFGQLKLAQGWRERADRVRDQARNQFLPQQTNMIPLRLAVPWDHYEGTFLDTMVHTPPGADPGPPADPQGHLMALRPHFNEMAEATAGLIFAAAADNSWRSRRHDDQLSLFVTGRNSAGEPSPMRITSRLPVLSWPPLELGGAWYLGLVAVLLSPFVLTRILARRVLLLNVRPPLTEELGHPQIELLSSLMGGDKEDPAKDPFVADEMTHLQVIDLQSPADCATLARPRRYGVKEDADIVLTNFDGDLDESKKKGLLTAIAKDHKKTVMILRKSERRELPTLSGWNVRVAMAQGTARDHAARWKACLPLEQLTLLQVARTDLVNSKRPELRTLLARGLLRRDPELRLVNESFRRFVLAKGQPDTPLPEPPDESITNWHNMKGALWVLLTGVAAFLFLTQRDVWNIVIGVATAFMAGLSSLSRLANVFKGGKTGEDE